MTTCNRRVNLPMITTFVLFFLFWTKCENDLITSTLKLCYLLQNELYQLDVIEKNLDVLRGTSIPAIVEDLREHVPKSYFKNPNYHTNNCLDDNSQLIRFVSHPINSFQLVKRFTDHWRHLNYELNAHKNNSQSLSKLSILEASAGEFTLAKHALYRLDKFYNLKPSHIAQGTLSPEWSYIAHKWTIVPKPLDYTDIVEIGKIAYEEGNYDKCQEYFDYAYKIVQERTQLDQDVLFEILDYLSYCEYQRGFRKIAHQHCIKMLQIHPEDTRVANNLKIYEDETQTSDYNDTKDRFDDFLRKTFEDEKMADRFKRSLTDLKLEVSPVLELERKLAERTCRQDFLWKPYTENLKGTYCYVRTGTNDFGKLIKVNIEKIYNEPEVFLFRNIVDDDQIQYFKAKAADHLRPATVFNSASGFLEAVDYRITQTYWIEDFNDPMVKRLVNNVRIATGLTLTSSESLQIANYGIGGYYDTHFDFARASDASYRGELNVRNGNRIATFLLYLSNVEIGGRTGFPRFGVSVQPSKRDALFWFNLHPDLSGDARTRHIACPIALGTKWVANFWIRSRGEENSRPCNLEHQDGV